MSKDNPVFVYGAVYADRDDADADYDTLLDLHSADLVGSYDVALTYKDDDGKVHVTKHEKPTQHGAWTGAAVGALVGIVFRPRSSARRSSAPPRAAGSGTPWAASPAAMPSNSATTSIRPGRARRDRQVAPARAARQDAHARRENPREGNQRRRQRARQRTQRAPRLAAGSSRLPRFRPRRSGLRAQQPRTTATAQRRLAQPLLDPLAAARVSGTLGTEAAKQGA